MHFHPQTVQARTATPLGGVRLAASPAGLCGLWFDGQQHLPAPWLDGAAAWPEDAGHPVLRRAAAQLQEYFSGTRVRFDLPLDLSGGTPFQQAVWQALLRIDAGRTSSYAAIARLLERPRAVRAVGAAVGRNPVSVVVPCHRVLGSGGALTGYAGGLPRKVALLRREGVAAALPQAAAPRQPAPVAGVPGSQGALAPQAKPKVPQ